MPGGSNGKNLLEQEEDEFQLGVSLCKLYLLIILHYISAFCKSKISTKMLETTGKLYHETATRERSTR